MRFYCHCLNVCIDVPEINDDPQLLSQLVPVELQQHVGASHAWLVCNVAFDQAVITRWRSLLQTVPVREMKLHRCLNCDVYTHATGNAANRILINRDLLDNTKIDAAHLDPDYSDVARVIIHHPVHDPATLRSSPLQDETVQRDCESAQRMYREAAENAERDKEERIRLFQREQEQLHAAKVEALTKELNTFSSLMRLVARQSSNTRTSPTSGTSSAYINENSTESGFGSDIFDVGAIEPSRQASTGERAFFERPGHIDEETIDDPMLDNSGWNAENSNSSNFATSVPREIGFRPSSSAYGIRHHALADDDAADLESIGKSFRDLSRSMCTDGTELFGDLPSPRLNSRRT